MPPRIVHLLGGLRAIDDQSGSVTIQGGPDQFVGKFASTAYPELYGQIRALKLSVVGVEFLNLDSHSGLAAPDWQCASVGGGFGVLNERNLWSQIRYAAGKDGRKDVFDIAARVSTYLDLLPIRIFELSRAYHRSLRSHWANHESDPRKKGSFFQNSFQRYIDAAIHAFAADAASFRDLIAESVWKLVLGHSERVTTLATFLKRAKTSEHPVARLIISAAKEGGWLCILTNFRNHITHVAPVGRASAYHMCQERLVGIGPDVKAATLHYALLDSSGAVRDAPEPDFADLVSVRAALEEYKGFCNSSLDALAYIWTTLDELVKLIADVRMATGLRAEMPVLTDKDLIGPVRFRKR
jgi:hypothetical protein